jgi:hypothetical protein
LYTLNNLINIMPTLSSFNDHYTGIPQSIAYILATELKARISFARIIFPASQFNGLSAAGSSRREMIARQADCKFQAGDHSFFRMSRQISPV